MSDPVAVPSVVSLFAGAGGMDIGLERSGWHTVLATDIDGSCMATLREAQTADIAVRGQPGRSHLHEAVLKAADVKDLSGSDLRPANTHASWRPDLLAGGPPCQPWSSAGLQKGWADDRGLLVQHFIRLAAELRPRLILFENVRGLVTAIGKKGYPGEVLELIKLSFEELGYATTFATLNAADYGAAQRRVRLFMMASCDHELPSFPDRSHERISVGDLASQRKSWVRLSDFIAALPVMDPLDVVRPTHKREAELGSLALGTGLRTTGRIENNRPGGHWGYRQDAFIADPNLPSRTIRAAATPDWLRLPDGTHRRLTLSECAGLQGFPIGWPFQGTMTERFRQVGNAVQADVAELLGGVLLSALRKEQLADRPQSVGLPAEFRRRMKYTAAEHRTNGSHRVRVRASVT